MEPDAAEHTMAHLHLLLCWRPATYIKTCHSTPIQKCRKYLHKIRYVDDAAALQTRRWQGRHRHSSVNMLLRIPLNSTSVAEQGVGVHLGVVLWVTGREDRVGVAGVGHQLKMTTHIFVTKLIKGNTLQCT